MSTTKSKTRRKAPTPIDAPPPAAALAIEAKAVGGKLGEMATLLRRPEGATIAQLAEATGWQAHSVRGAMAGALKKRGLIVTSEKTDASRVYRLPAADEVQS